MTDTLTVSRSESGRGPLHGRRVLFLPKNSRTSYFRTFLEAARRQEGWDIRVVCPDVNRTLWRHVVAGEQSFHSMPDFAQGEAWESDPRAVEEIDAFIAECERSTGVSAARLILAGERDVGRGYSKPVYYWFHTRMARNALADNAEPERIVRRMYAFARKVLQETSPDLLVGGEWAEPICFAFYVVARHLGIRCAVNRYSKVWTGRCFWSSELLMYNDLARALTQQKRAARAPVSERSREHIASFRAKPKMVGYLRKVWDGMDRSTWWTRHVELARILAVEIRHYLRGYKGPQPKPGLRLIFDFYRRQYLNWRNARFFRSFEEDELEQTPYIYLPLHKDPEQALNHQAHIWVYQLATVELASSCLPAGYKLLVREHRTNPPRRAPGFYTRMAAIPGVVLIDGHDSQFKYLKHADVVFTENGASAWEGLLLKRRVVTTTESFFDAAQLDRRVNDPETLAKVVLDMVDQAAVAPDREAEYDLSLGWYLDAEWEMSAPLDPEGHSRALEILAALHGEPAAVAPLVAFRA